ncbi:MAG TPA: glycosyltransferase [Blastocatellia bacterium]|nr:glycosyltransferase [Blastocatellia bacterium]
MKIVVFTHKPLWPSDGSPSGYATDGGFPMQMSALSELFDATTIVASCSAPANRPGEIALVGRDLSVVPLAPLGGKGVRRKLGLVVWLFRNFRTMLREMRLADAAHTPIPGDIGTIGMLLALALGKPLFVRHCGNWERRATAAEYFWRWFMETFGGGRNVMLATGGANEPPSSSNSSIRWIFSTSLTEQELEALKATRRSLKVGEPDQRRLIIVGRQEKGKGTETVLKSLALLLGDLPGLELDVVGDGSALPEFRRLADALGLNGRVVFHGGVDHASVMKLLRRADLFCFPTRSEGFPKVVVEAMACGLPIITTRVSVLPQIIGDFAGTPAGLLLEENTPTALAAAARECLTDSDRYCAMSAQAQRAAQEYSLERWRDVIGHHLSSAWGPTKSGHVS